MLERFRTRNRFPNADVDEALKQMNCRAANRLLARSGLQMAALDCSP